MRNGLFSETKASYVGGFCFMLVVWATGLSSIVYTSSINIGTGFCSTLSAGMKGKQLSDIGELSTTQQ